MNSLLLLLCQGFLLTTNATTDIKKYVINFDYYNFIKNANDASGVYIKFKKLFR